MSAHTLSRRAFLIRSAGLAVGATMAGSLLAACVPAAGPQAGGAASSAPAAAEPVTLTIWSIWDLEAEMKASELFAKFTEQTGDAVEHTFVPGDGWQEKFNAG